MVWGDRGEGILQSEKAGRRDASKMISASLALLAPCCANFQWSQAGSSRTGWSRLPAAPVVQQISPNGEQGQKVVLVIEACSWREGDNLQTGRKTARKVAGFLPSFHTLADEARTK